MFFFRGVSNQLVSSIPDQSLYESGLRKPISVLEGFDPSEL